MKKDDFNNKSWNDSDFQRRWSLTPVTVLQAGPCVVTQVKTEENDGYSAVQVVLLTRRKRNQQTTERTLR